MRNYTLIRQFLEDHVLTCYTRRVQAIWPSGKYQDMRIHCFADRAPAETFQANFGGEFFDSGRDREKGRTRGAWRREGVFTRLLASGPLSVPEDLRS